MEFIQLKSGKMLNLNSVTLISLQYNAVVYETKNGSAGKDIYEEFETPEEAENRFNEVKTLLM